MPDIPSAPAGGGGGPTGTGQPPGAVGHPTVGQGGDKGRGGGKGTVKADPQAINRLGTDLTNRAGSMLDSAHQRTGAISVSFPAFGVLGTPLNMAHDQVRTTAQDYLTAGRRQLDSWREALTKTADNYRNAEDHSTISDG